MKLIISIDVEEEGLFSGTYSRRPPGVSNVAGLDRLEFIPREFGFPLTLLLSYQVAQNAETHEIIRHWQQDHQAEIGAHLHHWNTPPFGHETEAEPLASREVPPARLKAKLETLVTTIGRHFDGAPRSFRMGRLDWWPFILDLLPGAGLRCDSSMAPMVHYAGRVDQYLTPTDPFELMAGQPPRPLLEIPLTIMPVFPGLARMTHRLAGFMGPPRGEKLLAASRYYLAAGIQPVWFPLPSMRLAARLHRRRGGRVLTMFFHSSELQPGATPRYPTEAAVRVLTEKIRRFLGWLVKTGPVEGVTLSQVER